MVESNPAQYGAAEAWAGNGSGHEPVREHAGGANPANSLAAATASVITARWNTAAASPSTSRHAHSNGNGHSSPERYDPYAPAPSYSGSVPIPRSPFDDVASAPAYEPPAPALTDFNDVASAARRAADAMAAGSVVTAPPVPASPAAYVPPVRPIPVSPAPVSSAPVSVVPVSSPPISAPPVSAHPVSAPPVSAPPVSAPPVSAPPVSAPPVSSAPPGPARHDDDFDSIIGGLSFPKPFVAEPYQPYDPMNPKPDESTDDPGQLPQRVPGDALVEEPEPEAPAPVTEAQELSRIATFLQQLVPEPQQGRREHFDVEAMLDAVRALPDVRDAQLRFTEESGHLLRIEFIDAADEGQVTREVARLLREALGLDEPVSAPPAPVAAAPPPAPLAPPAAVSGRASVPGSSGLDRQHGHPLKTPGGTLPRVVVDHVQVTTLGLDANVEVRLAVSHGQRIARTAVGHETGPAVDAYLLRLAAGAAADAINQLLTADDNTAVGRCFIEHVAVVPFGGCEVAVVVMLLVCGHIAEQLSGSVIVAGDPRQAVVRATLSAMNRRLESLLA